ncbi:hypothetical protein GCM10009864_78220 [Streptomyces lunalinharesii]|uniref:Uncharacterized protein n=1 Tax=Streptomyces lunalinharesii TaxID=333384 RepID=A0ABN3T249_9ACTN
MVQDAESRGPTEARPGDAGRYRELDPARRSFRADGRTTAWQQRETAPYDPSLVDQGLLDRVGLCGHAVQQGDARGVVVRGRRQDDGLDDQTHGVHSQASLPARHPFRGVLAGRGGRHPDGSVGTLRVQDDKARVG